MTRSKGDSKQAPFIKGRYSQELETIAERAVKEIKIKGMFQ